MSGEIVHSVVGLVEELYAALLVTECSRVVGRAPLWLAISWSSVARRLVIVLDLNMLVVSGSVSLSNDGAVSLEAPHSLQ